MATQEITQFSTLNKQGKHSGTSEHERFSVESRSNPGSWVTHPDSEALHAGVLCCVPYPQFEKNVLTKIPDQAALDVLRGKIAAVVPGYQNGTWLDPTVVPAGFYDKNLFFFTKRRKNAGKYVCCAIFGMDGH